ncbi:hypothetical protein SFUMM280S_05617 [Streptomyces fumanus]
MTAPADQLVEALRASLTRNEKLRAENERLSARRAEREPIAIVGMGCRFPGGVTSPEELWRLVADGTDAIGDLPAGRGWKQQVLELAGDGTVPQGGFVEGADLFDPAVFGIAPREALAMDPQQRLLLETSWEVLERAGIVPRLAEGEPAVLVDRDRGLDRHLAAGRRVLVPQPAPPVLLEDGVRALLASGHGVFVETSPHPVLTAAVEECAEEVGADVVAVGTLRRGDGSLPRLRTSLAQAAVRSTRIGLAALFDGVDARGVALPTYPFQRSRYWLSPGPGADARALGLDDAGHPVLGAAVRLADRDAVVLTGGVEAESPAVMSAGVLAELAERAADEVGASVAALSLERPLVLPEGTTRIQHRRRGRRGHCARLPPRGGGRAVGPVRRSRAHLAAAGPGRLRRRPAAVRRRRPGVPGRGRRARDGGVRALARHEGVVSRRSRSTTPPVRCAATGCIPPCWTPRCGPGTWRGRTATAAYLRTRLAGDAPEAAVPGAVTGADRADDPVVVVGMSCRLPGGIGSPDELWELLLSGGDAIGPVPDDRGWDLDRMASWNGALRGVGLLAEGGFLTGASGFDPAFFDMSPEEALVVDPQQRLLLELAWEAWERAGEDPRRMRGSRTGVYVGTFTQNYVSDLRQVPEASVPYVSSGAGSPFACARVAYTFGLRGPTLAVDTGCSSSGVALHLACQALLRDECSSALVGGVTVMAFPVAFDNLGGISSDGRCKSFSADADGVGWGEGAGVLVVERLSEARRRGHPVLAVIRGSALNHSGASNGLTAPHGPSQSEVMRLALADAGLGPRDVDVVEAHGTGTPLGDAVEAEAVIETYGRHRTDRPVLLGSVKANVGHPHAASGVVGVIKTVLAMRHGIVPEALYAAEPLADVDWAGGGVTLPRRAVAWPETGRPRRAGVSSFGGNGTKVHLILEQSPDPDGAPSPGPAPRSTDLPVPCPLSARSGPALASAARRLRDRVAGDPALGPHQVARSLAARTAFDQRR